MGRDITSESRLTVFLNVVVIAPVRFGLSSQHLAKKAKEWGVELWVMAQLRFDIPATYKFHKRRSVDVEVDLIRLKKRQPLCDPDSKLTNSG